MMLVRNSIAKDEILKFRSSKRTSHICIPGISALCQLVHTPNPKYPTYFFLLIIEEAKLDSGFQHCN